MDWISISTHPEIKTVYEEYGFCNVDVMLDNDQIAKAEFQTWKGELGWLVDLPDDSDEQGFYAEEDGTSKFGHPKINMWRYRYE
jgi:hypothetical protein